MNKTLFVGALLAACSLTTMADDYQYLTAAYSGVEQSVELSSIKKITFENNSVVIFTSDGQITLPQNEMEKMYFSATATAIESLPQESDNMKVNGNTLHVSGQTGVLRIFGANGTLQRVAKVDGNAAVNLSGLAKGVYIVKMGDQVIKIRK